MRIGIVGNYGNDNQGDESILEGIITQLEIAYPIERGDILVFTNNPEQTKQRYGTDAAPLFINRKSDPMKVVATIAHHRKIFRTLDLLIIGGGGILMDLYRNNAVVFAMYGILVRMTKVPAAIFGAGVGPIQTAFGQRLIKMTANSAKVIAVRDEGSRQLLKDIGVKKQVNVITDPAFYLPFTEGQKRSRKPLKIGVTAITYFHDSYWPTHDEEKYQGYIRGMAANLDRIMEKEPDAEIQFFATKHPYDTNTTKDIRDLMQYKDRTEVCDRMLTHREIISLIAEQDLVIGTRLHSLILSIVAKTPVIAVGYHEKVIDVMSSVGCKDYTFTIKQVSEDHDCMLPVYEGMAANWESTLDQFDQLAGRIIEGSPDGMELVKTILPN